ncbi:MAG: SURF1 family protein [Rhodocyclales bacterium]|nr:SURF1 family protein [Rhodocyclales bacterium]
MRRFQYSHGIEGNGRSARRGFRPSRAATLATALLLPVLLALGVWQLQRAAQKEALLDRWSAQAALAPLPVGPDQLQILRDPGAAGRRLVLHGHWDTRLQVLLDNQVQHGVAGYRLFTPLRIAGDRAVLVDRGWLAGGPRRELAPAVLPVRGEVALAGVAAPPPAAGPLARQVVDASLGGGLLRVQRLDIAGLSPWLDLDLEPWTLRTDPALPRLTPDRHRAYALQWFLLAALLAGLYVGLNLRR